VIVDEQDGQRLAWSRGILGDERDGSGGDHGHYGRELAGLRGVSKGLGAGLPGRGVRTLENGIGAVTGDGWIGFTPDFQSGVVPCTPRPGPALVAKGV
jgi:hypothetical protein